MNKIDGAILTIIAMGVSLVVTSATQEQSMARAGVFTTHSTESCNSGNGKCIVNFGVTDNSAGQHFNVNCNNLRATDLCKTNIHFH